MSDPHKIHDEHPHMHGRDCGHTVIRHEDHQDYLHDGHLHFLHSGHVDEHSLGIGAANPADCTPDHSCEAHDSQHRHGPACGHEAIPHGDHEDYLVDGHLHFPHGGHCDNHGWVQVG